MNLLIMKKTVYKYCIGNLIKYDEKLDLVERRLAACFIVDN